MCKGFELMREHCPPDEITDNADPILESLASLYRFDISRTCVQILLQTYPDIGLFHDFMAHNAAMLGQEEQAVQSIAKALELEPNNVHFRSNQGWIQRTLKRSWMREGGMRWTGSLSSPIQASLKPWA